ncbi:CAP domain-containing protein [Massilia sp. W12]|uniref:CAP domain-containing protein n=1 Tax=Massilia sp. W12 TaxID=3126507 RepID=UPI0030D072D6
MTQFTQSSLQAAAQSAPRCSPRWLQAGVLASSIVLSACGGSAGGAAAPTSASSTPVLSQEPGAPVFSGNTATDGFNWFNFRRRQAGLPQLQRNFQIDSAAQAHSDYQRLNNTITHDQQSGRPGFTGVRLSERLNAAGYRLQPAYAYGEVISSTGDASGFYMAEELVAAIYHRFVIFEPMFKEGGSGSASGNGSWYLTVNFAANNGYGPGIGAGNLVTWPFANQERVPPVFYSDYEAPDPVPGQNETGYPISVHADLNATVQVGSFTVRQRGGNPLPVRMLINASDSETPRSAASIIPLQVLAGNTLYDVQFSGTVDGVSVSRSWSFRTR